MSNYKRVLKFGATPLLLAAFLVGCSDNENSNKEKNELDVVATIDGSSIKRDLLIDKLIERYGSTTIQDLLLDEIILIEAKKLNIKITETDIKTRYDKLSESYGSEEELLANIDENNMTIDDLNKKIENILISEAVLKSHMGYTEKDLKTYFEENPSFAGEEDTAEAYHILVKDEKLAKDLIKQLDNSKNKLETFKELATKHSTDTVTVDEGGYLDEFKLFDMVKEFSESILELEPNSYSKEVVKTLYGYHLIYLVDKKIYDKKTFEEAKYDVDYSYFTRQYKTFIDPWKNKKLIEYKAIDLLNDIDFSKQSQENNSNEK